MLHRYLTLLIMTSLLGGCGVIDTIDSWLPDNRADYKKSEEISPLEFPPEVNTRRINDELRIPASNGNSTTYSEFQRTETASAGTRALSTNVKTVAVLPESLRAQIRRENGERWLVIQADADTVWQVAQAFWRDQGFTLVMDEAEIGVMETEWKENRADIPQDGIRKVLGKALDSVYSAATRDKFRIRLERGTVPGTTELHMTHRGAQEVSHGEQFVWQMRAADPELEAEMLNRLLAFMGARMEGDSSNHQATYSSPPPAAVTKPVRTSYSSDSAEGDAEGQIPTLLIREPLAVVWHNTGLALDRLGYTIEGSDTERSVYVIRYAEDGSSSKKEAGWFDWLLGSDDKGSQYAVHLLAESDQSTRLTVLDQDGQLSASPASQQILSRLYSELR